MVQVVDIPMSEEWILMEAKKLVEATVLVQGYEWTGFGYLVDGTLDFGRALDWRWSEYWDVRVFGQAGEWHCWRVSGGKWKGRNVPADEWQQKETREYVLRGREVDGAWLQESGGARFYYPKGLTAEALKEEPLRLVAWLEVSGDGETGQVYLRDAMLREIVQRGEG